VYNGNFMTATYINNGSQLVASSTLTGANGTDFTLLPNSLALTGTSPFSEQSSSTCVALSDCVFEITSQQ
jgi:hypothetical protein